MKKPAFQWQTARHRAVRDKDHPAGAWEDDDRAESFTLEFTGGQRGCAICGLRRQWVDPTGAADPDIVHAVRCWLTARGVRELALFSDDGELARGSFTPGELGDPVPGHPPQRVVTLAPSNAEMVDALGCFARVVACEDSSDHPPAVETLERLGPDLGPNLDRVAELRPDLVVSSLSVPGMERVVTGLRARSIPQLVLAPRSLADVFEDAERAAASLHVPDRGRELVARLREERAALLRRREASSRRPARVYLEWWPRPMYTPGNACYSGELIELAGGVNVFGDREGSSVEVSAEDIVRADPDVCFVSWCGVAEHKLDPDGMGKRPGLDELRAVKERRVFALDERFCGRPGPRMLEAARRMAAAIERVGEF